MPVRLGCVLPVSQPVMTGKIPSATNSLRGSLAGRGIAPTGLRFSLPERGLEKGQAPNEESFDDSRPSGRRQLRPAEVRPNHGSAEELKAELDDFLDEVDGVLEENAEGFVAGYIQKGRGVKVPQPPPGALRAWALEPRRIIVRCPAKTGVRYV